jgi:hypothetical protein
MFSARRKAVGGDDDGPDLEQPDAAVADHGSVDCDRPSTGHHCCGHHHRHERQEKTRSEMLTIITTIFDLKVFGRQSILFLTSILILTLVLSPFFFIFFWEGGIGGTYFLCLSQSLFWHTFFKDLLLDFNP